MGYYEQELVDLWEISCEEYYNDSEYEGEAQHGELHRKTQ